MMRSSHFGTGSDKPVSTALICLPPSAKIASAGYAGGWPQAQFLTQLIATKTQAPQTRLRRRAEPEEAIAAYSASGNGSSPTAPKGHALSRSL
jgi:hypothetical protein